MDNMGGSDTGFQQVYIDEPKNYNIQAPVSTGKWVGIHLIKWIPVVGGIVYLIMLFIWAFGSDNQNETFRNWAKAELIMTAIVVVIWVVLIVVFGTILVGIYDYIVNDAMFESPMY